MTRFAETSLDKELEQGDSVDFNIKTKNDGHVKVLFDGGELGERPPAYTARIDERVRQGGRDHQWQTAEIHENVTARRIDIEHPGVLTRVVLTAEEAGRFRCATFGD